MRETEWEAAIDPEPMLKTIKLSKRQNILLNCACCRYVFWSCNHWTRKCVEFAEKYADGEATPYEIDNYNCQRMAESPKLKWILGKLWHESTKQKARQKFADYLRDIVGSPHLLKNPIALPENYLTPDVKSLAIAAYHHRGSKCQMYHCRGRGKWPDAAGSTETCDICYGSGIVHCQILDNFRVALVGDALEDAGCDNTVLLDHFRSKLPHVRGCWALDLVMGKQA